MHDSAAKGYFSLVRQNSNFRNLWFGQIISLLGDWFNLIASASLIALLTKSGLAVGGLFVVRMLAPFLVSPIAGVVVDRYNRKHLLIAADIIRGVTVFGFLLVRTPGQIWLLYTLTAIQLGLSGFFFPGRNAILANIVARGELGAANALSSATWSTMLALGAALGGFAAGRWGIYPSFIIDGLTFFLSAIFISLVRYQPPAAPSAHSTRAVDALREYLDGLRYLKSKPDILVVTLLKASMALSITGAFQVVQVAIAERVFVIGEGGAISLGVMYAVIGIGTGLGPIFARKLTADRPKDLRIAVVWSYLVAALGMVITAPLFNFPLALFGMLLRGVGAGVNWVFSTQLLYQLVGDRVRGRVFSVEFALMTLMNAAGATIGGWGVDMPTLGMGDLMWGMGGLTLVMGIAWMLWLVFRPAVAPQEIPA